MKELDSLLEQSVHQYQAILEHSGKFSELLGQTDDRLVRDYTGTLKDMQDKACQLDNEIKALSESRQVDLQANPLFKKRLGLISEIIQQNELISPKIAGKMAVIAADMAQVKKGRNVMSGYKPNIEKSGRKINQAH